MAAGCSSVNVDVEDEVGVVPFDELDDVLGVVP